MQPSSLGNAVVEHKAQRHFEGLLLSSSFVATAYSAAHEVHKKTIVPHVVERCTLLYSARMSKRKRLESVRYSVRLSQIQSERLSALREQIHARSDNEVFDYLVTVGTNQRDDLEQLVYSLFGNLTDSLARKFQSLETISQLHLALTDTFIKYALTALPEVPPSLMMGARARATKIYEQVNITAAREFQRRRESDAYSATELGLEEAPTTLS